ncbi:MAG: hypothetical protein WC549_02100 [Actinomycetota bacterium]
MAKFSDAITWQKPFDDRYKTDIIDNAKTASEDNNQRMQNLINYFDTLKKQATDLQKQADKGTKFANERKDLIQSIDGPTVKEMEQQNPIAAIRNYLPGNPTFALNWANAFSSASGNKPTMPTWNPDFDAQYNEAMTKRLNEVQEYKTIASIDPEKRSAKDMEKLNRYIADKVKQGEWKTAKQVLKAMPENYSLLEPEGKIEVLTNSSTTEQAYLIWKQKKLAKIKEGEEERRKNMNVFEKSVEDADKIQGDDWFSNVKRGLVKTVGSTLDHIYKPLQQSAEKYSTNAVKKYMGINPVASTLNMVGAAVDFVFSAMMTPLNAATGFAQQTPVADQYNLINNAAMQIMNLPGTGAAKVAEQLGVDDPELLQSISSIGNASVVAVLPAIKGRLAKGIEQGIAKKLSEGKSAFEVAEAQKMQKVIDPAGKLADKPNENALPVGEKVIKEAVKSEAEPKTIEKTTTESLDVNELQKRREAADKESSMLLEDETLFDPNEVAELRQRVAESGKTEREYAIERLKEIDDIDTQIKTLEEQGRVVESGIKKEEVVKEEPKIKEEEYADEYDPYADDVPDMPMVDDPTAKRVEVPDVSEKLYKGEEPIVAEPKTPEPTPTKEAPSNFADTYSKKFAQSHIQESLAKMLAEAYDDPVARKSGKPEKVVDDFIAHSDRARQGGAMIGELPFIKELADPEFRKQFKQEFLDDVKKEWDVYNASKEKNISAEKISEIENQKDVITEEPKNLGYESPQMIKVSDVEVHPEMQFKSNAGEGGVTARDKISAAEYDPKKAGTYLLMEKPDVKGKYYIVDGHHRFDLAKEKNTIAIPAYISNAKTITEARAEGALINIANGKGSAIDVARFMKEKGFTSEDLKSNDINIKDGTAAKRGIELSELSNELLDKVEKSSLYDKTQETISAELLPEKYGAIIGKEAPIPTELAMKQKKRKLNMEEMAEYERLSGIQREAYRYLVDNPDVKPAVLSEIIKEKMGDKQIQAEGKQSSMFGDVVSKYEKERAELRAEVEKRLSADINIASTAKNQRKAAGLEEKGLGSLNVEQGKAQYDTLKRAQEVYQKNKYTKEYSDLTNEYAKKMSEAKNGTERKAIADEFYETIRDRGQTAYQGREAENLQILSKNAKQGSIRGDSSEALRKWDEIPLEKTNSKTIADIGNGSKFFDKETNLWTVERIYDDGSFRAYDGIDPVTGGHIRKIFNGDIEVRGLNSPETAFSGGLASKASENAMKRAADLEMANKKISKDDPRYAKEMDKTLKEVYEKNNFANMEKHSMIHKLREKMHEWKNYALQRYNLDYKDPKQAYASVIARELESNQAYAINRTKEAIYHTVKPLEKVQDGLQKFSMYKSLKTVDADIRAGLYDKGKEGLPGQETLFDKEYKQLPNGWTKEYIEEQIAKLDKEFAENPYLKAANDNWNDYWAETTAEAVKAGTLPKDVLKNPDYMHKQIKEYYAEAILEDDLSRNFSDYRKGRTGSAKDFNTNWTMATAMAMKTILQRTQQLNNLKRLVKQCDVRPELIEKAKKTGTKVVDMIPADHVRLQIDTKSDFAGYSGPLQRYSEHVLGKDIIEQGAPKEIIVHKNIANLINDMRYIEKDPLNKTFKLLDKGFKVNVLYSPTRYAKYEMRNAYSDISKLAMTYPGVFKKLGESYRELKDMSSKKAMASDLAEAYKSGIVDSGMNSKEFREVFKSFSDKDIEIMFDPSKRGMAEQYNIFKKFYKGTIDFNNFRENMFRLATYKYFKERTLKGDKVYGASNYKIIDAVKDPTEKAAVLARELLVDYGNSSALAQRFARGVVPFYRWIEGNPKGIINWVKNIAREDGTFAGKTGKITVRATAGVGMKAIKYVTLSQAMYGAVQLWNRMAFPESHYKLNNTQARRGDLIIWEKDDGALVTLPLETAVNDFLGYIGLDDWMTDLTDYVYQRKSGEDIWKKTRVAPINKLVQSALPIPKMALESISGKSYYDIYNPTPIIDNARYWAKALQAEPIYKIYKSFKGERLPERNGEKSFWYNVLGNSIWNETNVNEIAYNMIRGKGYKYNAEKKGKEAPSGQKNEAELALYYMKQAVKYKDYEAEKRYRQKYIDLRKSEGKTNAEIRKGMETSVRNADPIAMISKKDRDDFVNNYLSQYERELLKQASQYYKDTYANSNR